MNKSKRTAKKKNKKAVRSHKVKLTPDFFHEACDRTYIAMEYLDMALLNHPVIKQDKELKTTVEDAIAKLWHVYQKTGAKT